MPDQEVAAAEPEVEATAEFGERYEKLPEVLVNGIKTAIKEFSEQEQYVRRREVIRDRQNRFYEQGYQHIYESRNGNFVQGTPEASITTYDGRDVQCPMYMDDYNIYEPFLRTIESVQTQNRPGIAFRPINPNKSEDMEAAETAEGYSKMFDRANDQRAIHTEMVRMFCVSGRVVNWTRTEANGPLWGYNPDGSPKRMEICTVHGTIESRVPILCKSQDRMLVMGLFDDPDAKEMKAAYPEVKAKIKPGSEGLGESAYERTARLGVLQSSRSQAQIGDAFNHLVTRGNWWLRPNAFIGDKFDEVYEYDETGAPVSVGDALRQIFPEGVHVVFCGDVYCEASPESPDDHLAIGHAYKGDGQFRLAIMDPMVVVQDRFNDNMNASAEVFDMGWPSTWVNADDQDYDAIQEQVAAPYAIRQHKVPKDHKLGDFFFREPNPELPKTFLEYNDFLFAALPQFMLACPPAIFGAAMEDQKTASGYAQAKSQALGQQGLWFAVAAWMFSRMYYQAALAAMKNPDHENTIVIPGEGESTTIQLEKLTKGKFGAYPDEDNGFPESTDQKRAVLTELLDRAAADPVVGAAFLAEPDNWKEILSTFGVTQIVIPQAEARDKQTFEIEQLLKNAPIPPTEEEMQMAMEQNAADTIVGADQGQEVPPPTAESMLKSSVPVDELDFHEFEFAKCQQWLSSQSRRRQDADGNQLGVLNVKLHALEHQKYMMAAAAQMAAMAPAPDGASAPEPKAA